MRLRFGTGAAAAGLILFCMVSGRVDAARKPKVPTVNACSEEEFPCDNGSCVPKASRCNNSRDCADGSDEVGCDYFLCRSPQWYRCKHDNGTCISASFLCDKHDDCPLGDDEENCENFEVPHVPVPCSKFEFTCTDKMCIPKDLVCDGTRHCLDGSDETIGCMDVENKCKGFLCKNKHCVQSHDWVCDGVDDCGDGSDEENCFIGCTLEHGKFECADNSTCVDLKMVCDGKDDCGDRSDETGLCTSRECDSMRCPEGCKNTPHGSVCLCKAGFVFDRKSKQCEDVNECERYGLCSQGCENTPGSFRCTCASKFKLRKDGRTCEIADSTEALLLYTTQKSIGALYLTSKHQYYVAKNLSQVIGVSYDGSYVYWTDISFKTEAIERSLEDGSKRELLLTSGLASPEDLALDWLTGNIYFSDSGHMMIAVCSNNGQHCSSLIQDTLHKPRGIALLPQNGTMFYSDWGDKAMIGTAGMDGKNRRVLIDENIHWPNGLSLDWPNGRLYWVDAKLKKIESVRLDGTQRTTVIGDVLKHPFAISVFNDRIYWSDWDTKSIQSCDKFSGKQRKTVVHDRQIFDVHVYHSSVQPKGDHACIGNFCSHLCLLAQNNSYSCACPYAMSLKPDKHSCRELVKRQFLLLGVANYLVRLDMQTFGRHELSKGDAFQFFISRMVFNTINGELLVADNVQKAIFAVDLKSKASRRLIGDGIGNVSAMAFDYLGNNLYWADSERSTVEVYSLQSKSRAIVQHYLGTEAPIGLAVIPEIGKMFVALRSVSGQHTHIDRQDMTGRGQHMHIIEQRLSGNGSFQFVVDRDLRSVFWNDMGNSRIEFTSYEGDTRHLFREFLRLPVSIAIVGDNLFWTCLRSKRLYWSDKHNLGVTKKITVDQPPYGAFPDEIVLLATQPLQRYDHPCQKQNGGCSHICVAAGMYSSACVCPTGMIFRTPKNTSCIDAIDCEFKCTSGECLTISKRCNGHTDCADGSDEKGCEQSGRSPKPVECRYDQFACADRTTCITQKLRCDKHYDCPDRSDEKNCEGYDHGRGCHEDQHACPDGSCIDVNALCDGYKDCADGSDEQNCAELNNEKQNATTCGPLMFRCSSGQCIPRWWECDGSPDCTDGSDEHAKCGKVDCRTGFTKCALGHCIEDRLVCDGNNDCGDNSDEANCTVTAEPCVGLEEDNPTKFLCQRSGKCLPIAVRCNGTSECPNGEDEAGCSQCGLHDFQCKSGTCIRKEWQCDKEVDCDDGSDEVDCDAVNGTRSEQQFHVACGDGAFECKPGVCIEMSKVCDGRKDCSDGKDEGKACSTACAKSPCEQKCLPTPNGAICECRNGYTLAGNRKSCQDVDECAEGTPCAQQCSNTRGSFRCACQPGFMLRSDKVSCKAVGPSRYVLYTSFDQIRKLEVNPPSIRVLLQSNGSRVLSLAVDVRREALYWIDEYAPVVYRHDLAKNASFVLRNVGHPTQLAVDWITGNVYLYDVKSASIKLCSFERQVCVRVIKFSSQVFIKALAVDPVNHSLFYSLMHYWIFEVPHSIVYRANLDGSHQQVVVMNVSHVTSLECDPENRMLYMTDATTKSLFKVDYEGNQVSKVNLGAQSTEALSLPIGMTLYENQLLILNMASSTVGQCKLYGDFACKLLQLNVHNSNHLLVVQESRQPMITNNCERANCSVVCVPAELGPKCICHEGETVREGDQCPRKPNDDNETLLVSHPLESLHEPSTSPPSDSTASTIWHVLFGLTTLTLVVGSLAYVYRRRFQHKFNVGMHFHNPELSTIDASEVKMFQGAPQIHHTATHTELTLETPPAIPPGSMATGSGGEGSAATSRDVTTTALELENMSDADSMKDAYDCGYGDDQRQRLIM